MDGSPVSLGDVLPPQYRDENVILAKKGRIYEVELPTGKTVRGFIDFDYSLTSYRIYTEDADYIIKKQPLTYNIAR